MIGNLEPDERVLEGSKTPGEVFDELARAINKLQWSIEDDITIEIGGTSVSGIEQPEGYNKKWSSQKGDRKYNKDAFIVIKNQSRRDLSKSQPNPDLKGHHAKS